MERVQTLIGHDGIVWCVAWSPTGNRLASCGQDRVIRLWRPVDDCMDEWRLCSELREAHQRTIRTVAFSPDGHKLAAASFDGTVSVWVQENSEESWRCAANLEGHDNEVKWVAWSPDGSLLSTCGRDKTVWIWQILDDDTLDFECLAVLAEHSQDVKHISFHPLDSQLLISASYDDSIRLYRCDVSMGEDEWMPAQVLQEHRSTVWATDFNAAGSRFVSVGDDQSIVLWRQVGNARMYEKDWKQENAAPRSLTAVAWQKKTDAGGEQTDQDSLIAVASGDRSISLWSSSIPPVQVHCEPISQKQQINSVAWNPKHHNLLAAGGDEGLIQLWRIQLE